MRRETLCGGKRYAEGNAVRKKPMKNDTDRTTEKRKTDKILFIVATALFVIALALWVAAFVLFKTGEFAPDHSRYFIACLLLACGGITALYSAMCLFFSPLVRDKRRRVCPFCGGKVSGKDVFCGGCGKRLH